MSNPTGRNGSQNAAPGLTPSRNAFRWLLKHERIAHVDDVVVNGFRRLTLTDGDVFHVRETWCEGAGLPTGQLRPIVEPPVTYHLPENSVGPDNSYTNSRVPSGSDGETVDSDEEMRFAKSLKSSNAHLRRNLSQSAEVRTGTLRKWNPRPGAFDHPASYVATRVYPNSLRTEERDGDDPDDEETEAEELDAEETEDEPMDEEPDDEETEDEEPDDEETEDEEPVDENSTPNTIQKYTWATGLNRGHVDMTQTIIMKKELHNSIVAAY